MWNFGDPTCGECQQKLKVKKKDKSTDVYERFGCMTNASRFSCISCISFFNGLVDAEFCRGTDTKLERCLCNNNTCTYVFMYGEIKKKSIELILKSCLDFF